MAGGLQLCLRVEAPDVDRPVVLVTKGGASRALADVTRPGRRGARGDGRSRSL